MHHVSPKEFAQISGLKRNFIVNLCKEGKIPCITHKAKYNTSYRIDADKVSEIINNLEQPQTAAMVNPCIVTHKNQPTERYIYEL
jgi:predicted site-specific integrase-resolvase